MISVAFEREGESYPFYIRGNNYNNGDQVLDDQPKVSYSTCEGMRAGTANVP